MRIEAGGVLAAILVVVSFGGPVSAATNLSCKAVAVSAFGSSQQVANAAWVRRVTTDLGAVWAGLNNAKGYAVHRHSVFPGPNAVQVIATPCAALPPTTVVNPPPHPRP